MIGEAILNKLHIFIQEIGREVTEIKKNNKNLKMGTWIWTVLIIQIRTNILINLKSN